MKHLVAGVAVIAVALGAVAAWAHGHGEEANRLAQRGRGLIAAGELEGALLAYSRAYFLSDLTTTDPAPKAAALDVVRQMAGILETLAIREPDRLLRAEEVYVKCLGVSAVDRACREGVAAALARQLLDRNLVEQVRARRRFAEAATSLESLLGALDLTPDTTAVLLLARAMEGATRDGRTWTQGNGLPWLERLDKEYPQATGAAALFAMIHIGRATPDDADWSAAQCVVPSNGESRQALENAKAWLTRAQIYSVGADKILHAAHARTLECSGNAEAARLAYREALVTDTRLTSKDLWVYAATHHRSLFLFLNEVRAGWDVYLNPRIEAAVRRLEQQRVATQRVPTVSRPTIKNVAVYPREVVDPSVSFVVPPAGDNSAAFPLAILADVSDDRWLASITILVDGVPVKTGASGPGVILAEPHSETYIPAPGKDSRRIAMRLALPPRTTPYTIGIEAVSITCPSRPCRDHKHTATETRVTVRIAGREEVEPPKTADGDPERPAIIVGVGNYTISGLVPLTAPPNDARALRRVLLNPLRAHKSAAFDGREMDLLIDGAATKENILNALARRATRNADGRPTYNDQVLLLYLSGHGKFKTTSQALVKGDRTHWRGLTCFMPAGVKSNDCNDGISVKEIADRLEDINVRAVVIIIDSCYSGDGRAISPNLWTNALNSEEPGGGAIVIAASGAAFKAVELRPVEHGLLTAFVLDALRGKAADRDGAVTLLGLWDYVQRNLPDVKRLDSRKGLVSFQTPTLTSFQWKEPIVLVHNGAFRAVHDAVTDARRSGRLPDDRTLRALKRLVDYDPDPDRWQDLLDQSLVREFASGRLRSLDDLKALLSSAQGALLAANPR